MINYEKISFTIITNAGSAKSFAFEAIQQAEEFKFNEAENSIEKGRQQLILAEQTHMEVISKEAAGDKLQFSFLLMHAEDQMVSTQLMLDMAESFINIYKKLEEKK